MIDSNDRKADCYAAGERAWMEYGQRLRAAWLNRWLNGFTKLGITPDAITLLAGCVGICFLPLWLAHYPRLALLTIAAHVLLDGIDGPLARFQQIASPRGSFTDTFADQLVVTAVTIGWMVSAPTTAHILVGSLYLFLYALVVAMAMVRNALTIPYSWLVRPRFFVYLAIAIDWWLNSQWTFVALAASAGLLAIKCTSGFLALRRELPGPPAPSPVPDSSAVNTDWDN